MFTYINKLQNQWVDECYKSLDTSVKSLTNIYDYSSEIWSRIAGHQTRNLETVFSTNPWLSTDNRRATDTGKTVRTGVAVVTGGIGGIGTGICKRLAADGNRIVATYIPAERNQAKKWKQQRGQEGYSVDIMECDVTDFDACKKLADKITKKYGTVDILVNAAGITRDAMLKKMEPETWQAVLETNLDSVFNVTRHFINSMIVNGYGRIINISSVNGQKGQFGQTNYSTAKAGMIGFTRSLALEVANQGITVNCVCPGYVQTSMVEAIRPDILQSIIDQIPVGRLATVSEIAEAVAFLANENSSYITGTELAVNGGMWLG